jgi:hypothetical protein
LEEHQFVSRLRKNFYEWVTAEFGTLRVLAGARLSQSFSRGRLAVRPQLGPMLTIIIIVLLVLALSGGGYAYRGPAYGGGGLGLALVILLVLFLLHVI